LPSNRSCDDASQTVTLLPPEGSCPLHQFMSWREDVCEVICRDHRYALRIGRPEIDTLNSDVAIAVRIGQLFGDTKLRLEMPVRRRVLCCPWWDEQTASSRKIITKGAYRKEVSNSEVKRREGSEIVGGSSAGKDVRSRVVPKAVANFRHF
jgi:hypothetical protein